MNLNVLHKSKVFLGGLSILIVLGTLLAACTPSDQPLTPSAIPQATLTGSEPSRTATVRPSSTPTPPPLGSVGNPIILGFVLTPEDSTAIEAAEDLAFLLSEDTEYAVEYAVYPDFQSLASGVVDGNVHLMWLAPFEYLYLESLGIVDILLMTNHLGVYSYGVQFLANQQHGFRPYFDAQTNQSTSDHITALQQFAGTRPCFLHPDSIPGYFVPLGLLANASTPTLDPVFAYSYDAIIRALYIQEICDFGVSYALIGDPLNSSDILQNLPDAQSQVEIIWQTGGIIPNTNLSASRQLPLNIRFLFQESMLKLSNDPVTLSLLSSALSYDVASLREENNSFYDALRSAIIPLELDLSTLTQKPAEQ